ncbi:MAG TPA: GDSL-type esterase/lipase family protein [Pirellulaceae bacterium]|jgi:lysophospholipase L1-like esterase
MRTPLIRLKFVSFATLCVVALTFTTPALSAAETATPAPPASKKPAEKPAKVDYAAIFKAHWIDFVQKFREQNKKGYPEKNVILLGDSITEGFHVDKHFPDRHVLNRGIGADIIGNKLPESDHRGILRRMDESIFDTNPSDVFLLIGINDLGMGHKPADIEAGDREILAQIKKRMPDVHVHIESLLPTRGNYAKHNPNVLDANNRLQKLAQEFGYDYVDLHSKMSDDKGELKEELTKDGLHLGAPGEPGYKIWKAEIDRIMGW